MSDIESTLFLFDLFNKEKQSEYLDISFNKDEKNAKCNTSGSIEKDSGLGQNSSNEIALYGELETLCNNNINSINENLQFCEEGKNPEKIITFEDKPYLLDINDQEYEDKIYNNIFSNKLEIDQIKPFNITKFNDEYKNEIRNEIGFKEPPIFIELQAIINENEKFLSNLWKDTNDHIFKDKDELSKVVESKEFGIMYQKIVTYLKDIKGNKSNEKRKKDIDQMILKIKNKVIHSFLNSTNSFNHFKKNHISTIKHNLINKVILADFNIILLNQPLCSILSNESSEHKNKKKINSNELSGKNPKRNEEIIQEALNDYNNGNRENKILYGHLYLTFQECLDIFRYKKAYKNCNYRLVDFLFEEFKSQTNEKKNETIPLAKVYIASLLLLAYNYELFFYMRKKNAEKKKNPKILGRKIKFCTEK